MRLFKKSSNSIVQRKNNKMKIVKHSGDIVDFNREKLHQSLLRSGARDVIIDEVLRAIEKEVFEGISTKKIYKLAFRMLKQISGAHAARYNLRDAIQQLGPAGFFFEKFVARIFLSEGYETITNLTLQGKCVSHEIDVCIRKNDEVGMVECKFHAGHEANSNVKVPMYIFSRFNDLKGKTHRIFTHKDKIESCRIVTNNRFTGDAITYATCSGIELLSWDYPAKGNLKQKIDTHSLYPVTCLTTLSLAEKEKLLILNILLTEELLNNSEVLKKIELSENRIKNVLKETAQLSNFL